MTSRPATLCSFLVLAAALLVSSKPLSASIVVDPDGVGATDVSSPHPSLWDDQTGARIGEYTSGTVRVDGTNHLTS